MPVIGRTTREYQYRCDKSSTGDEKLALQPHEMLTMALISISKEQPGISDDEELELKALSLIAEDWAPLLDGRNLRDKDGNTVLDDYSRIMINGTLDTDTGIVVPIPDDNTETPRKAIKITPLNTISEGVNKDISDLITKWKANETDEEDPDLGKYRSQLDNNIITEKILYDMASERLRPLIKVEIFSDYAYAEIEDNSSGEETEEENDEKPKTKTIVLEAKNCIYPAEGKEDKYWTDEKLTQHGFISKSPSLIWE